MLFYIDAKLTILVLLLIGGSTFMTTKIANKNKVFADQSQAELGQLNNKMEEYLAGNLVTKPLINSKMLKKQLMLLINNIIVPLKSTVSKFCDLSSYSFY